MAAPAPMPTNKAGSAQHMSVPPLVNSDSKEAALVCLKLLISDAALGVGAIFIWLLQNQL